MDRIGLNGLGDTLKLGQLLAEMLVVESWQLSETASDEVQSSPRASSGSGVVLGLCGTLGAGKTNLAQSLISALGIPRYEITSPTFSLVQSYSISVPAKSRLQRLGETGPENLRAAGSVSAVDWTVHHVDAYRIADDDEFLELGIEELIEQPATLTLIEWAGKVANCLPSDTLWIEIQYLSENARQVSFSSPEPRWAKFISDVGSRFAALSSP